MNRNVYCYFDMCPLCMTFVPVDVQDKWECTTCKHVCTIPDVQVDCQCENCKVLDETTKKSIPTVNVIETVDGQIFGHRSFHDDEEGNRLAERLFHAVMIENGLNAYGDADQRFAQAVEDGYWEDDNYKVVISHSCF